MLEGLNLPQLSLSLFRSKVRPGLLILRRLLVAIFFKGNCYCYICSFDGMQCSAQSLIETYDGVSTWLKRWLVSFVRNRRKCGSAVIRVIGAVSLMCNGDDGVINTWWSVWALWLSFYGGLICVYGPDRFCSDHCNIRLWNLLASRLLFFSRLMALSDWKASSDWKAPPLWGRLLA
jgi:hypothetical protein